MKVVVGSIDEVIDGTPQRTVVIVSGEGPCRFFAIERTRYTVPPKNFSPVKREDLSEKINSFPDPERLVLSQYFTNQYLNKGIEVK